MNFGVISLAFPGGDAALNGAFRLNVEGEFHQRLGYDHGGRRAPDHGDVSTRLPKVEGDVMAGAGGTITTHCRPAMDAPL